MPVSKTDLAKDKHIFTLLTNKSTYFHELLNHTKNCSLKDFNFSYQLPPLGQDSIVDIATCYRLYSPGIKSQWRQDFPHLSRLALGTTQPPIQWVPGLFLVVKWLGCGVSHSPPSRAAVKAKVELYILLLI